MSKTISQKRFIKGVSLAVGRESQQPGTVLRISNLLLTKRGSLLTCDGSAQVISSAIGGQVAALGVFNSYSSYLFASYAMLVQATTPALGNVGAPNAIISSSGLTIPTTYGFVIVAYKGGIEHTDSGAGYFTVTASRSTVTSTAFTWVAVAGATSYSIYYVGAVSGITPAPTSGVLLASGLTGTSYTYTGTYPLGPVVTLPQGNTSLTYELYFTSGAPSGPLTLMDSNLGWPGLALEPAPLAPGDPAFSASGAVPGYSPFGGLSGIVNPIPQIIPFAGELIVVLGNGLPPELFNPTSYTPGTHVPVTNTFQATYPAWQASVSWLQGNQITVTVGGQAYIYTAQQSGVSGTTEPTFPAAMNATVADNQIIWENVGPLANSTAPRGAAHAIVYEGSLLLANTSPQTTSDNLDGPTVLKASDANNPNSYNPVNIAFIGRDDGTQITGLAVFTIAEAGIAPTGTLVVFKEYATYQVIGFFGATDFAIIQAQTDMGCISPRSIQFLPGFGIVRFTHFGFAVFDGVRDRVISEEIRPYLFGGTQNDSDIVPVDMSYAYVAQSVQSIQPPMYLCAMPLQGASGQMTRLFCFDLILKAWTVIDLPWPLRSMSQVRIGNGLPLLLAGRADQFILERLQAGDTEWDSSTLGVGATVINWSFRTQDIFGEGGSQRLFFNEVVLRGSGTAAAIATITAKLTIDGHTGTETLPADLIPQNLTSTLFEIRFRIWRNASIAHIDFAGSGPIVIDAVDWQIDPKSTSARRVIS